MSVIQKYAFIDRDGTILIEPPDKQIDSLKKFSFSPGVIDFLLRLKEKNYSLALVTNQDGLGTSSYPKDIYEDLNSVMFSTLASAGINFSGVFVCPHFESDRCGCRKPLLGMLPKELQAGNFNREESFVVGDRESDLLFAENLGIKGFNCQDFSWKEILREIDSLRSYRMNV